MPNLRLLCWAAAERLTHLRMLMGRQTGRKQRDNTEGQFTKHSFLLVSQLSSAGDSRVFITTRSSTQGQYCSECAMLAALKTHRSADSSLSGRTAGLRPPEFKIKTEN